MIKSVIKKTYIFLGTLEILCNTLGLHRRKNYKHIATLVDVLVDVESIRKMTKYFSPRMAYLGDVLSTKLSRYI